MRRCSFLAFYRAGPGAECVAWEADKVVEEEGVCVESRRRRERLSGEDLRLDSREHGGATIEADARPRSRGTLRTGYQGLAVTRRPALDGEEATTDQGQGASGQRQIEAKERPGRRVSRAGRRNMRLF
jgi:hypothetical protein